MSETNGDCKSVLCTHRVCVFCWWRVQLTGDHPRVIDMCEGFGRVRSAVRENALWALVMLYSSAAFAIGAATGRRTWAISGAAGLVVIGFLGQLFASLAEPLEYLRPTSPWYWFLGSSPLTSIPTLVSFGVPVALAISFTAVGIWRFNRRDLGV